MAHVIDTLALFDALKILLHRGPSPCAVQDPAPGKRGLAQWAGYQTRPAQPGGAHGCQARYSKVGWLNGRSVWSVWFIAHFSISICDFA